MSSSTGEYPGTFDQTFIPLENDVSTTTNLSRITCTRLVVLMLVPFSSFIAFHCPCLPLVFKAFIWQVSQMAKVIRTLCSVNVTTIVVTIISTLLDKRRKPYLIFFSASQALGFVMLAYGVTGVTGAVLSLFIVAFSASFCSAIAEALLVELTEGERQDASNSISEYTMVKALGSFLVAYLSGYLLETLSKKAVFIMTSMFPLMITVTASFMTDSSPTPKRFIAEQITELMFFLKQKLIWGPSLFILVFMCGPDYDDALFFYYTNVLGFNPSFMGTLRFTYSIAAVVGLLLYRRYLTNASYKNLLWITILVSLPIYLSPVILVTGLNLKIGVSDKVFVLSGGFLNEAVAEIQLMPLLVLTACLCPPGLEGSAYSTMFAVRNLGTALSKGSSAVAMSYLDITASRFDHLVKYIWICGAFNLLPFIFINMIPTDNEIAQAQKRKKERVQDLKIFESRKFMRGID